ncbi:MAG: PAS domain-containing methyl-accepting chemotaxis protein [Pseudomonadota bacterium]|nr:PAS domain-containing methyl-accepting chemotaxis protein [Pseudomonadota bacterium]MDP1903467.1 PAS domain-containing methyl-accepting chemotaxis protein [Pseudomonadota bacterium]MDP2351576.1 PAS domain-containing methyl-accepting chemotaxis protein [Pseudomonadota bacterium]
MRNNQPVSQREYPLREGAVILSWTDAKGNITFANDDFVEASGFTREELIGQPQNLVRHPDMPAEAFRDLWATIKAGDPWVGLVKNRRRDGDHYWVKATVTPTPDGGFMSVRIRPGREEVQAAEALYQRLREDSDLRLDGGKPAPSVFGRLLRRFMDLNLSSKLWLSTLSSMLVILLCAGLGWMAIEEARGLLKCVEADKAQPLQASLDSYGLILGIAAAAALLLWPAIAFVVVRSFTTPLRDAVQAARGIAAFDLSKPAPLAGHDEVGEVLAQFAIMRNNLLGNASLIKQSTRKLDAAAHDLTVSSSTSAQAAMSQSEAAAGMAAAVEELSVSIDQVSDHAREANDVSRESGELSREGGRVIHSAADEIGHISEAVQGSAKTIRELESYSGEISTIVGVIKEIADQTNLLALNAAIEAARAGEQGRGFAVVADEVRKLAERTGNSTQQITGMIDKVQSGARRAVEEMEASVKRVSDGVELAHKAGDSISNIQTASTRVMQAVADIDHALKEQGIAAREIAQNVERVAQMTEQGSHASRQASGVADDVVNLSLELKRLADLFKL